MVDSRGQNVVYSIQRDERGKCLSQGRIMGAFFSYFAQIVCLICLPPVLFGLAVWGCRQLYVWFVGDDSGRPLIVFSSVLSTPLREAGHAMMAVMFLHRVEDMRLLKLHDPKGEFGYVEHSYNPHNPVAVLGNFFYALGPVITGLFAVLIVLLTCFHGVLDPFLDQVRLLGESGAGFGSYVAATFSLIPALFAGGDAGVAVRILGCVLLLMLCLGIHVTPREILDALFGCGILVAVMAVVTVMLLLFDLRVMRNVLSALRTFAAAVTALFLIVAAAAAAMLILGLAFGVIRTLFNIDTLPAHRQD